MFGFPRTTEFNKRIPKKKFYDNIEISSALRRAFTEQIASIFWRNKLASDTLNVADGQVIHEIEVFEICLTQGRLDEAVLRQIDMEIHYHILFILSFEGKYQAWTCYKEAAAPGGNAFRPVRYYHTGWMDGSGFAFKVAGLNMDAVYDSIFRQVAGDVLQFRPGETLKDSVERSEKRRLLEEQIAALEAKIRKEKQLNRQMEINAELKRLRIEFEKIEWRI